METRIEVRHGTGTYPIVIDAGQLERDLSTYTPGPGPTLIISTPPIAKLYGARAQRAFQGTLLTFEDGEAHKTLATVSALYRQVIQHGADRSSTLVALGGGVVGDVAGFVAATYMRGVRFVQCPTTLLAMVDSSVGGKVGVDVPEGKNLVGAFKQPAAVLFDPTVLETLPPEEYRAGLAETIKHGLVGDEGLLDPKHYDRAHASELVARSVRVKIAIVEADPYEANVRQYLNLGHTFGHAIERITNFRWRHGDAVAVGLVAALRLSEALNLIPSEVGRRVTQLLKSVELPTTFGDLTPEALWQAMATDKKWRGGRSRFVLLEGIERPVIKEGVERTTVLKVLETLRSPT